MQTCRSLPARCRRPERCRPATPGSATERHRLRDRWKTVRMKLGIGDLTQLSAELCDLLRRESMAPASLDTVAADCSFEPSHGGPDGPCECNAFHGCRQQCSAIPGALRRSEIWVPRDRDLDDIVVTDERQPSGLGLLEQEDRTYGPTLQ